MAPKHKLLALFLVLFLILFTSYTLDKECRGAVCRGDFPAFYTASYLYNNQPHSLYDTKEQKTVQSKHWQSLKESHLYYSYPPYVAFFLKPLSFFNPKLSKLIFCSLMFFSFLFSLKLLNQNSFSKLAFLSFLFFPNLAAVFSGQNLGLSILLLAIILKYVDSKDRKSEMLVGLSTGIWFFKPHFALFVVLGLASMRRWRSITITLAVAFIYFLISFFNWNKNWISIWLENTKEFYNLDSIFNGHKQISFIGFFENIASTNLAILGYLLTMILLVLYIYKSYKEGTKAFIKYLPFVIILCSPHTMYYESGLVLVPFFASNSRSWLFKK